MEGNFPFWLNVDNRMMADEFFRPSYTSGIWAQGDIIKGLQYQVMLGNNLSTLGVNSGQLNNKIDTLSSALIWMPTTKEFGKGFGDFENHETLATRLALHYTRSIEDKQAQPNTDAFENTQIRLSDGTVVFTPNIFGPGVTVNQLLYQMSTLDAGVKYHGFALEGEYYWRRLDQFEGPGTPGIPHLHDTGFQLQASMMAIPKTLQLYLAGSKINGQYGNPWDTRVGMNWFPVQEQSRPLEHPSDVYQQVTGWVQLPDVQRGKHRCHLQHGFRAGPVRWCAIAPTRPHSRHGMARRAEERPLQR